MELMEMRQIVMDRLKRYRAEEDYTPSLAAKINELSYVAGLIDEVIDGEALLVPDHLYFVVYREEKDDFWQVKCSRFVMKRKSSVTNKFIYYFTDDLVSNIFELDRKSFYRIKIDSKSLIFNTEETAQRQADYLNNK